jgi:hypothetical protein
MSKPILCLDFDGVIHDNYRGHWIDAAEVSGGPVEGALEFINEASGVFEVHVYSSRSHRKGGLEAMQTWLRIQLEHHGYDCYREVHWPRWKPGAHVFIDDRAVTFEGYWPDLEELKQFKPWNR